MIGIINPFVYGVDLSGKTLVAWTYSTGTQSLKYYAVNGGALTPLDPPTEWATMVNTTPLPTTQDNIQYSPNGNYLASFYKNTYESLIIWKRSGVQLTKLSTIDVQPRSYLPNDVGGTPTCNIGGSLSTQNGISVCYPTTVGVKINTLAWSNDSNFLAVGHDAYGQYATTRPGNCVSMYKRVGDTFTQLKNWCDVLPNQTGTTQVYNAYKIAFTPDGTQMLVLVRVS